MKRLVPAVWALVFVFLSSNVCWSQEKLPSLQIGTQFTLLRTGATSNAYCECAPRRYLLCAALTLHLNKNFALDATFVITPDSLQTDSGSGRLAEGLFGLKAGVAGRHYGFFAKARPGFITWSRTLAGYDFSTVPALGVYGRRTEFALDLGGGVEFFPNERLSVRFDLGDTLTHARGFFQDGFVLDPGFHGNLQASTSVYLRMGKRSYLAERQNLGSETSHKFFDGTNIALMATSALAQTADMVTTQHFVSRGGIEGDPIARPFVSHGWGGQLALFGIVNTSEIMTMYGIHRLGHHRIEKIAPIALTIASSVFAYHNAKGY